MRAMFVEMHLFNDFLDGQVNILNMQSHRRKSKRGISRGKERERERERKGQVCERLSVVQKGLWDWSQILL